MTTFSYTSVPLKSPATEIRLLELYPSDSDSDDHFEAPLRCRLFTTPIITTNPATHPIVTEFKALSYVWGDDTATHSIAVSYDPPFAEPNAPNIPRKPSKIAITTSLDAALRHIRHPVKSVTLWIDQISINQTDFTEKGHQVQLMGKIYASATQVLVWIGPAADGSDDVMNAMRVSGQWARDAGLESYYARERFHLLQPIISNVHPDDPTTILQSLKHWFERTWFTRLWVVQEFCLCPDTVFVCGDRIVAVELVMLAVQLLQFCIGNLKAGELMSIPDWRTRVNEVADEPTAALFSCRQRRRKFDRGEPQAEGDTLFVLLRKLYVARDTGAKQHRDRVYGLLGLAVDTDLLGVKPDYMTTETGVILTGVARAIVSTGRVDLLCFTQGPKRILNYRSDGTVAENSERLPTWVPDWRPGLRESYYKIHENTDSHVFNACGGDSQVEVATDGKMSSELVLGLGGYTIDTIEEVAPDAWTDMDWDHKRYLAYFGQMEQLWLRAKDKTYPIYGDNTAQRKEESLWRVPIGDRYWSKLLGELGRAGTVPDVAVYHRQCWDNVLHFAELDKLPLDEMNKRHAESGWEERYANGQCGQEYREGMRRMVGMRPFLTERGYLGMGPADAREGDVVVVFCGGRIPFVLRHATGEEVAAANGGTQRDVGGEGRLFSFVGEAFCDGVMDGEVVTEVEKKRNFFLV
ncbi:heterokaryon incompatibility protein-domain-containing protein [Apodospora peruviana]|uniref:Heterokaryon incompatibility protein-domain-containing protein n=1 Tax=Apodospora peruviana TaxID=516989 RepID=A0AAE0I1U9_9PEZI|nr:heterokaryon incompatibility protein-domain-containing protein [Apodospora peruviana]